MVNSSRPVSSSNDHSWSPTISASASCFAIEDSAYVSTSFSNSMSNPLMIETVACLDRQPWFGSSEPLVCLGACPRNK